MTQAKETDEIVDLIVRLPTRLRELAAARAESDGDSLNDFIVTGIAALILDRATADLERVRGELRNQ